MAKTVSVVVTDDIDGSTEAEAVTFSFNGQVYEIDFGPANRQRMRILCSRSSRPAGS